MNIKNYLTISFLIAGVLTLLSCSENKPEESEQDQDSPKEKSWEILDCEGSPNARHENSFVEVNDKFYLLGGRGIKPVNIFDPASNSWTSGAEPPVEVHHFQAVAYAGKIYIIGAMTGPYPREKPLENILIYDPANDAWEMGDTIPEERRRGSAGVIVTGDKAIVLSGIIDGHWEGHVPWTDQYDFSTGEWTVLADAPRPRDHFHAAMNEGKIYCAGGRNSSAKTGDTFELTIPEVDVYDIADNSWSSLPEGQHLPTERAGTSSAFIGQQLVIIGGESASQEVAHAEVEAYHTGNQTWERLDPLVRGRHGSQAIVYKGAIYIAAGSGNRGGSPELDTIERYAEE
ncbi:galactose oxidase [Cyclobacterium sp.]|uniref:Kelch repeat-containing protein n=1 Tax=Cyclobacterium sp. TaxID=1966343 RepID=UPI0019CBA97A|nr:galactose oxidase [Cyclobacterium sp.]MBD3628566.1 galactose oxidase [Cyclobacterium sp.]